MSTPPGSYYLFWKEQRTKTLSPGHMHYSLVTRACVLMAKRRTYHFLIIIHLVITRTVEAKKEPPFDFLCRSVRPDILHRCFGSRKRGKYFSVFISLLVESRGINRCYTYLLFVHEEVNIYITRRFFPIC